MIQLKKVVQIRAGHPFRARIEEVESGSARVIQMRDVNAVDGVNWDGLVTTDIPGRKDPDWLRPGDLLFAARGQNNFALNLDDVPSATVLSPHFFHLTPLPGAGVLPAFVAWFINQEPAQQYLRKSAEGSDVPAIRRQVLEELPITVPPVEKQHAILELDRVWQREQVVMRLLMENGQRMMGAIARDLLQEHENF